MLPLAGIRVIDVGSIVMAPYASQWLGDLGADVIKVETLAGDSTRYTGPGGDSGMAAIFLGANRNKRSIALDLRDPQGRAALLKMVDGADIFLHNIRPQKLAKIDIAPEMLLQRNPRLIYAGLHGFATDGPYGGMPAYDDIIQGLCGNADLMQRQYGVPKYFPTVSADKTSGLVAAIAILAALAGRQQTGRGSVVEIPMFETMVAFNMVEHLYGAAFDPPRGGTGYARTLTTARGPFRTSDGFISMMPYTDQHWHDFFAAVGAAHLTQDPRFANIGERTSNIELLYSELGDILISRTTAAWLALCEIWQIPAAPVLKLDELLHDKHLTKTGFFRTIADSEIGTVRFPGIPVRLDGERPEIRLPPRLGEHTSIILAEAGFSAAEIAALIAAGAARQHQWPTKLTPPLEIADHD